MKPSRRTTTAVDQWIYVAILGYILAVLSSYCPWYQYVEYDINNGVLVRYVFLGDWGFAFALGDFWTYVLFMFRQALYFGGLFGGFVTILVSQVLARRREPLCFTVALLNVLFLPCILVPCLLVAVQGFPLLKNLIGIPEIIPVSQGYGFGFSAGFGSLALIVIATVAMVECMRSKAGFTEK